MGVFGHVWFWMKLCLCRISIYYLFVYNNFLMLFLVLLS
jgi:hypothetical protein